MWLRDSGFFADEGMAARFVDVALPVRVDTTFQYSLPPGAEFPPPLGSAVEVPFGKRRAMGYCVGHSDIPKVEGIRAMTAVRGDLPPIPPTLLKMAEWISWYYASPIGMTINAMIPKEARSSRERGRKRVVLAVSREDAEKAMNSLRGRHEAQARALEILLSTEGGAFDLAGLAAAASTSTAPARTLARKKIVRIVDEALDSLPWTASPPTSGLALTADQESALQAIRQSIESREKKVHLLLGVTGSGKTEVYLRAIDTAIAAGGQVITLVPEIALTPQMVGRYLSRFKRVSVWHSALSSAQRRESYRAVRKGEVDILVGARSAVFAPFERLRLIVVDEEHETSFKQQNEPRYNARDVAVLRGSLEGVPVILGSATPSLETYHNAIGGKYVLHHLPTRVDGRSLPPVEIVDLSTEKRRGTGGIISERLRILADGTLSRGEQAIFFLNRRGYSTLVQCASCGFTYKCPRCEISLTFHRSIGRLVCHYCRYGVAPAPVCPECITGTLRKTGIGVEQVEKAVKDLFPEARVCRMDSDSITSALEYLEIYKSFVDREKDVLIGTQMVAKGFDFPFMTLVGVVLADGSLNIPDFRSAERTFQLITQVAGRAGRGSLGGRVIVQTFRPGHYSIQAAKTHDYAAFAEKEMEARRAMGYPPFGHTARILFASADGSLLAAKAAQISSLLRDGLPAGVRVLGPAPAPIGIINGKRRSHVMILSDTVKALHSVLSRIRQAVFKEGKVRIAVDVDPADML